jgi:hypothetical protein
LLQQRRSVMLQKSNEMFDAVNRHDSQGECSDSFEKHRCLAANDLAMIAMILRIERCG